MVTVTSEFFPTPYWAEVIRTPGPWRVFPLHYIVKPLYNQAVLQYVHSSRVK